MAFPTYPYGYQPGIYPQAVPDQLTQLRQQQMMQQPVMPAPAPPPLTSNGIIWVQGEAGAKAYPIEPGTSLMLMDSEEDVFYIKTRDPNGKPQPLQVFDYRERTSAHRVQQATQDYVPRSEFNALAAQVAALMKKPEQEEQEHGSGSASAYPKFSRKPHRADPREIEQRRDIPGSV